MAWPETISRGANESETNLRDVIAVPESMRPSRKRSGEIGPDANIDNALSKHLRHLLSFIILYLV